MPGTDIYGYPLTVDCIYCRDTGSFTECLSGGGECYCTCAAGVRLRISEQQRIERERCVPQVP